MNVANVKRMHQPNTTNVESIPFGYKKSEIGIVPFDWRIERVDAHTSIKTGSRNTQDRVDDGLFPFFVRSQQVERINSYSYNGEAVLTAGDGVGTGKVFHYINGPFDVHQRVYQISEFSELNGRYFFYQFSSRFYDRIMSMTAKSSVDSVRMEMIAGMKIPIPPLPEQEAIAEALADVDALLAALDKLIAKKRAIKQAAMQQLLTGKTRLPGFGHHADLQRSKIGYIPSDWHVASIGELFSINAGGDLDAENSSDTRSSDYPYPIYANSISNEGLYGFSSIAQSKADSITVTARGTLGWACHRESPFVAIGRLLVLEPKTRLSPRFYCEYINQNIQFASESTGVPQLTAPQISQYFVPLPSEPEQRAISTVLSDMDAEIAALEKRGGKTQQIKQGMMQQLLTGRIRLVNPSTAEAST